MTETHFNLVNSSGPLGVVLAYRSCWKNYKTECLSLCYVYSMH